MPGAYARWMRSAVLVLASLLACGDGNDPARSDTAWTSTGSSDGAGSTDDAPASDATTTTSPQTTSTDGTDDGEEPPPDMGTPGFGPLRIAVVSDLNGSYGSTSYEATVHAGVAAVVALAPDLVLSTGDMVAGQQDGLDYPAMWTGFHTAVSDPLAGAGLPFAVTPGNHDASGYPAFLGEREEFVAQWQPRKPALEYLDDTAYPLRYSFVAGPALFVALDDTTVGPLAAEQMTWLGDQLEAGADRPAKIVFGHLPLWPFAQGREDEVIGDPALEDLLVQHDVTLFVSGHHHAYYPGRRADLRLAGTACLGSGPRALIGVGETSARAILVVDLDARGTIAALDAYAAPDFATPIDRAGLPASITYDGVTVDRDDG